MSSSMRDDSDAGLHGDIENDASLSEGAPKTMYERMKKDEVE